MSVDLIHKHVLVMSVFSLSTKQGASTINLALTAPAVITFAVLIRRESTSTGVLHIAAIWIGIFGGLNSLHRSK